MSTVLDWEKLAEIATRASVECVGEVPRSISVFTIASRCYTASRIGLE
jgi:hypothetical protein